VILVEASTEKETILWSEAISPYGRLETKLLCAYFRREFKTMERPQLSLQIQKILVLVMLGKARSGDSRACAREL